MTRIAIVAALLSGCGSAQPAARPATAAPRAETPHPAPAPRDDGLDAAIAGAAATVRREAFESDLRALVGVRSPSESPERVAAAAAYVEHELSGAGLVATRQSVAHAGATADNVVAERPGSDPSRVILVGAHYDTVPGAPGADDNASGVAAMLAIARAIRGVPTRATIRFVAFAFEEDGLLGSMKYVESLDDAETRRIAFSIVFDMVAYRTDVPGSQRFPPGMELLAPGRVLPTVGDFIGVVALTDLAAPAAQALAASRAYAGDLKIETLSIPPEVVLMAPDLLRGDHASLWLAEIPAIAVGDTGDFRNPNYHRPSDVLETVDLAFGTAVARWSTALVLLEAGPDR